MKQKQKELLLKDLCARLPYGIKFPMICWDEETGETVKPVTLYSINKDEYCRVSEDDYSPHIDEIRPYLFPLSSMTEEQKKEYDSIIYHNIELHCERYYNVIDVDCLDELQEFYHNNHFDYRGLIPMGLANDATNLNIY